MAKESELVLCTKEFLELHWSDNPDTWPSWSRHWEFEGEIPNHMHPGCYALFKGAELVYVGVGIARGSGKYINHGLGDRLKNYWQVDKSENATKKYTTRESWKEITSISTIPFQKYPYLAAALELFLISNLSLERNKAHAGKKQS